jgi:hypothetical protein
LFVPYNPAPSISIFPLYSCPYRAVNQSNLSEPYTLEAHSIVSDPDKPFKDMAVGQCPENPLCFHVAAVFFHLTRTDMGHSKPEDTTYSKYFDQPQ